MTEYTTYPRTFVETAQGNNGWGPLVASIVGAAVGYVIGRNNNGCGNNGWNNGNCGGNGCQTCFQQGEYSGESRAADNFIAQKVNGIENMLVAMNNDAKDQRISDLLSQLTGHLKTAAEFGEDFKPDFG